MDQRNRPKNDKRIDPDELETTLRVIGELDRLPAEHPDSIRVQQAAAGLYKSVKIRRRQEKRRQVLEHDAAITALTATAAPDRIDDETEGLPLVSSAKGAIAGTLIEPRACYICKKDYREVDAFYHQLCPDCAAFNHARRDARTDLTGKRAAVFCTYAVNPGKTLDKLTKVVAELGADVVGGMALHRNKLEEQADELVERLTGALAR